MLNNLKLDNRKGNNTLKLYHGSKGRIKGNIKAISRKTCDFGKGFYMGTDIRQPLTLICKYNAAYMYELNINISDFKHFQFNIDLDWAFFIAYNRGLLDNYKSSNYYHYISKLCVGYDLISGYIANDKMFYVIDEFFNNNITDTALLHSLSALKLGKQYVAITQDACNKVKVINSYEVSETDKIRFGVEQDLNRKRGTELAKQFCKDYRRMGKSFDEILEYKR